MKTPTFLTHPKIRMAFAVLTVLQLSYSAQATNGVWNSNTTTIWSTPGNWVSNSIADGIGATADFSQLNITGAARTVTIDGAVASRTVGTFLIGDANATDNRAYVIAASGGGTLTFNNSGSGAVLTQISTSAGDTISAPVILNDNLLISNAAAVNALTLSTGGITSGTAGTKTLTTSTGNVAISGIIGNGSGTVAVVQDGSGTLTLSGTNTFTGGLTVKNGTIAAGTNASALGGATGTGSVTLGGGAGSGSANASLVFANSSGSASVTYANPITVQSGGTGTYTISNTSGGSSGNILSGGITLNNNLTISETNNAGGGFQNGNYLNVSGAITGSGNLTLAGNGGLVLNNSGQPTAANNLLLSNTVGTTGTITNSGSGNAFVAISGTIANATGLSQNSATSVLALSASNNTYSGATAVNNGVLRIAAAGALSPNTTVTVASGATLQVVGTNGATGQTLNLSGAGTSYSTGALEATNTGSYVGNVVLAADSTISSDFQNPNAITLTVGTVGSTTITGSGRNLTVTGNNATTFAGSLNTGAGTLTKLGTGTLTLSGANSFTGLTSINRGTVSLNISTALNGGGNITFGGGTLQYTTNNNVDYSSRILNSASPISIDTNSQTRTLSGGLAASNTGGLTKIGSGTLTLSGTNSYTGMTAVNGGVLAVSATTALAAGSSVFTDVTGTLNQGGAYTGVQGWLNSGKVATGSLGAIALTASSSENIDFSTGGFSNLMLGASTASTYTGTITPAGGTYRLGGGTATITLTNTNALTGGNTLVVGARSGNGSAGGGVLIGSPNNMTGATTVASSTLTLNSGTAGLATSDVTVNRGASLTFNYAAGNLVSDNNVTRAKSLQLNGVTLTVSGNTGGNSTETITNALTFAQGQSIVNITPAAGKHSLLAAGTFARNTGGTVLFTGTSLGVNANAATNVSTANISFGTTPTLNGAGTAGGAGGTTTVGILTGAYGDTVSAGTGLGSTGGLVTYDATNGVRLLAGGEYQTSITDGQTALDNIRLSSTGGSTLTTTLNSNTSINSLSILTSTTASSSVQVAGSGTLKLNSGVIYASATTSTTANGVSNAIDFNTNEGIILSNSTADLNLSGVLSNTGGNGLTKSGSGQLILSGTASNTYTGTTTINGGTLKLGKTAGLNAVTGDLVINTGATLSMSNANQIADSSNVTVNGGTFMLSSSSNNNGAVDETIHNLTMTNAGTMNYGQSFGSPIFTVTGTASVSSGATLFQNSGGQLNITGLTSLSDGGTLTVKRSQSPTGVFDGLVTLTGGLDITNTASGAYTPVTINPGINIAQIGGKLFLNGDLTFTGNTTNLNTTTIEAITGSGPQGVLALGGTRTFNVGNGAAVVDLTVAAPIVDGASAGGLTKTGAGTLAVTGASAFTGPTTVSTGTLLVNNSTGSGLGTGNATVNGGKLGGTGAFTGSVTVNSGGTLAPGASVQTLASGALTLNTGSTFDYELDFGVATSVGADLQVVSGNLTLSGTANLTLTNLTVGTFANATKFTLINYNGTWNNGLFTFLGNSLADDSVFSFNGQSWQIDYNASSGGSNFSGEFLPSSNFVNITAVPEPSTWALLAVGLTVATILRRRRA